MYLTKIASRITQTFQPSWERNRSLSELRSFVDTLHARVEDVELEIAL